MHKYTTTLVFILWCAAVFSPSAMGQVPLREENFDYPAGTRLVTVGWNQAFSGDSMSVVSPGLSYAGYAGSGIGNSALVKNTGQDVSRSFSPESTGSVYAAALIRVDSAYTGDHFFGTFYNNTYRGRVFARASGGGFQFGLSKGSNTGTYEAAVRSFGTPYLVVVKYSFGPGPGIDDTVSLFVEPGIGSPEPAPTVGPLTDGGFSDLARVSAVYLRQGTAGQAPWAVVDGIRAAADWATAVAGGPPSTSSDIIAAGNETSNINYAAYQSDTIPSTSYGVRVWSFTIRDGGGAADVDLKPTAITSVKIDQGAGNGVPDWSSILRNAALFDGVTKIADADSITGTAIYFGGLSGTGVLAPDNGSKTISLYLTFDPLVTDNQQLQFRVTNAGVSVPAGSGSYSGFSGFADLTSSVTGDANRIEVTADRVGFVQQPTDVVPGNPITPAVTVEGRDLPGSRDRDYGTNIVMTATGAILTGSPVSVAPTSGLATFSTLSFSTSGAGVTLTATSGLFNATSDPFNVTPISTVGTILPFGNQVVGTSSSQQSYSVSGVALTANIIVTPPSGFQISLTSGSGFSTSPVTLIQSGGIVPPTTIYVRFSPVSANGVNAGNITHTSAGATPKNMPVEGNAISLEPATQSAVTFGAVTSTSIVVNFAGGNGNHRIIVARIDNAVDFVPADGAAISGTNSNFSLATDQGNGNKVVYDGTASTVTVTGLAGLTTYHVASYEYNLGTGSSQNYLVTAPGTGNRITNPAVHASSGTGGGLWGSTGTWAGGVVPTQNDSVVIVGTDRVILGANGSCYSLNVLPGAKLYTNVALPISPPAYLRVYGRAINIDGTLGDTTASGADDAMSIEFGGNVTIKGTGLIKPARIRPVSDAINASVTFDANTTLNYAGTTGTGGAALYTSAGTSDGITITVSPGRTLTFRDFGRLSMNADANLNGDAASTINILGTVNLSGSSSRASLKVIAGKTCAVNVGGTMTVGGDFTATGGGTTTVTVNGSLTVGGVADFRLPAANVTGSGTFTLPAAATLVIGSPQGISAAGATGQIQTATRNFSTGANYSYRGSSTQITGSGLPSTVASLTVNTASAGTDVLLSGPVTVDILVSITNGDLDLNGNTLTLGPAGILTETTGNAVTGASGTINATRTLTAPTGADIAGLGIGITSAADLGSTLIKRGHGAQAGGIFGIQRYFEITPTTNTGLNATLLFKYHGSELQGVPEANLALYTSTNGGTSWSSAGGVLDSLNNALTLAGINSFAPRWTAGVTGVVSVPYSSGWNMIANPLVVPNDSVQRVFTAAAFPYAFMFNPASGYAQSYTLNHGVGYWEKFAGTGSQPLTGTARAIDTVIVAQGWNMIGSVTFPADTGNIVTEPPGIRATSYFGYNSGYTTDSVITPGKAYWVKASAPGQFILSSVRSGPPAQAVNPIRDFGTVTVTDASGVSQTLYLGADDAGTVPVTMYDMPPAAPGGIFDARFESGRMVEVFKSGATTRSEHPVSIAGALYPLMIEWNIPGNTGRTLRLNTGDGGSAKLEGSGSMAITNPSVRRVVITTENVLLPREFALDHNYPNPFNPSTTIRYALPVQTRVAVAIYNLLGQEVKRLVDEVQEAGYRTVEWDGTTGTGTAAASGVYLYRLEAGNFVRTMKMVLVK